VSILNNKIFITIFAFILAVSMCFSFTGCGATSQTDAKGEPTTENVQGEANDENATNSNPEVPSGETVSPEKEDEVGDSDTIEKVPSGESEQGDKIGDKENVKVEAVKVDCECDFTYHGDSLNGGFSLLIDGKSHGHGWRTDISVSQGFGQSNDDSESSNQVSQGTSTSTGHSISEVDECGYVKTENGYYVICPVTGEKHIVEFK
jgi:hypothetical protein